MNFFNRRSSAGDDPVPSLLKPIVPRVGPMYENYMQSSGGGVIGEYGCANISQPKENSRYSTKKRSGS